MDDSVDLTHSQATQKHLKANSISTQFICAVGEGFDRTMALCFVAAMPSKQHKDEAASTDDVHKTTINLPVRLYEDLKMLAAIEPGVSFNTILVRAASELVDREKETLDQLRKIAAKRAGVKAKH